MLRHQPKHAPDGLDIQERVPAEVDDDYSICLAQVDPDATGLRRDD